MSSTKASNVNNESYKLPPIKNQSRIFRDAFFKQELLDIIEGKEREVSLY